MKEVEFKVKPVVKLALMVMAVMMLGLSIMAAMSLRSAHDAKLRLLLPGISGLGVVVAIGFAIASVRQNRKFIRADANGLQVGRSQRFLWSDIKGVEFSEDFQSHKYICLSYVDSLKEARKVKIFPHMISNGGEMVKLILEGLPEDVKVLAPENWLS